MTRAELIELLERAEEGSRELDNFIRIYHVGFDPDSLPTHWPAIGDGTPHYTTNLQDALQLVPEGYCWEASSGHGSIMGRANPKASIWLPKDCRKGGTAFAKTPQLALCIACLRAQESTDEQ